MVMQLLTITLNEGADVVKFTSALAADANTIIGFAVTGTTTDKLSFLKTAFTALSGTDPSDFTAADNGGAATFVADKVYKGTDAEIKAIASSDSGGSSIGITFAIAINTGDIYAVTDTGTDGQTVTTAVIGNVGSAAATAIANGTFADFIEIV